MPTIVKSCTYIQRLITTGKNRQLQVLSKSRFNAKIVSHDIKLPPSTATMLIVNLLMLINTRKSGLCFLADIIDKIGKWTFLNKKREKKKYVESCYLANEKIDMSFA